MSRPTLIDLLTKAGGNGVLDERYGSYHRTDALNEYLSKQGGDTVPVLTGNSLNDILEFILATLDVPEMGSTRQHFFNLFSPGSLAAESVMRFYFTGGRSVKTRFLSHVISVSCSNSVYDSLSYMITAERITHTKAIKELFSGLCSEAMLTFSDVNYFDSEQEHDDVILREAHAAARSIERLKWLIQTDEEWSMTIYWNIRTLYTCIVICNSVDLSVSRDSLVKSVNAVLAVYTDEADKLAALYRDVVGALYYTREFKSDTFIGYVRRSLILTEEVCGGDLAELALEYPEYTELLFEEGV